MAVFINRIYESTSTDILKRIRRIIKSSFPERRLLRNRLSGKDDFIKNVSAIKTIIVKKDGEL